MIHGHLLEDGKLVVDNTLLASEAKCQLSATVRFTLDQEPLDESLTLVSGQAIHKALEVVCKGGAPRDAMWALEQFYKPKFDEWTRTTDVALAMGMTVDDLRADRRSYENVARVVGNWLRERPASSWPFQVDTSTVEATFVVLLDPEENIWYSGTPDVGRVQAGRETFAVDHKSTGRMTSEWRSGFRTSGQVSGYLWGLEQVYGVRYTGMFINGIELTKVPGSTRKCSEHGVPYAECGELHLKHEMFPVTRTPEQIESWKRTAVQLARRYKKRLAQAGPIEHVMHEGELTGACAYCGCREWCATGRDASQLVYRFRTQAWDPMARFKESGE